MKDGRESITSYPATPNWPPILLHRYTWDYKLYFPPSHQGTTTFMEYVEILVQSAVFAWKGIPLSQVCSNGQLVQPLPLFPHYKTDLCGQSNQSSWSNHREYILWVNNFMTNLPQAITMSSNCWIPETLPPSSWAWSSLIHSMYPLPPTKRKI